MKELSKESFGLRLYIETFFTTRYKCTRYIPIRQNKCFAVLHTKRIVGFILSDT